ncbi:MAG: hypothetical protein QXY42_03670 [Candidatus Bathyarchaeia archaeon]
MELSKKEKDKEYWAEYMKRRGFVTPKIDASKTGIRDLKVFCNMLFPFNPRKAELAEAIFREMSRLRTNKVELYRDLAPRIIREKRCSARTLSQTWKALLRSGLLYRTRRNEPAKLSDVFSNRLEMIANYWREVMKAIEDGEL